MCVCVCVRVRVFVFVGWAGLRHGGAVWGLGLRE